MPSSSNKKLLILYVLQVLREYSDENHPMMQAEISKKIYSLYGMESERKAIGANIGYLEDYGYDIVRVKNKGVYLGEREFERGEIAFLVDAIFSDKAIGGNHSKQLAEKLYSFLSMAERKRFKYIYKAEDVAKTDNKQLFYTIEVILEAIEKSKKIEFLYEKYGEDNEKIYKKSKVSPYFLMNTGGQYYLVCGNRKEWDLNNYKLALMTEIALSSEDAIPINEIEKYSKGIDIAQYVNEHIYAFGGSSVRATLRLYSPYMINSVEEWFDKDTRIYDKDGATYADVKVNKQALIYWAMQYGKYIEVVKPQSVRDEINGILSIMQNRYTDNDN